MLRQQFMAAVNTLNGHVCGFLVHKHQKMKEEKSTKPMNHS